MNTPENLSTSPPRRAIHLGRLPINTPQPESISQPQGRDQDGSRYARRPFLLALTLALSTLLTGCATYVLNGYQYDVVLRYTGKGPISNCKITSTKGVEYEAGFMIPGFDKTMAGPFRHTAADQWTVRWKPATGDEIARKVDLTIELPKQFEGRLIFIIDAFNNLSHTTSGPASR